ncbi:MAG: hypothetical protein M8862_02385, partial [marine benthic group bacterium]|nr:hypothetical protein [Gemmatimonadota bacterium]
MSPSAPFARYRVGASERRHRGAEAPADGFGRPDDPAMSGGDERVRAVDVQAAFRLHYPSLYRFALR